MSYFLNSHELLKASRRCVLCLVTLIVISVTAPALLFAENSSVKSALSVRHDVASTTELIKMAGSEDKLIAELLALRHDDSLPFISIRAEKLLLQYSDRADVMAALEEDLNDPKMQGLARVVAIHIDSVPSNSSKEKLARGLISRAKRQASFEPFARTLQNSQTETVSRLAREELK